MNKPAVMISIRPEWCQKISLGQKTIEIRKSKPRLKPPFKCYIYCTSNRNGALDLLETHGTGGKIREANQKVIGEFVCREIINIEVTDDGIICNYICSHINDSCVPYDDIVNYIGNGMTGYGWRISDLVIYDQPKALDEFVPVCKYRNDDGTCQYKKVSCDCAGFDYNHDGSLNLVECLNFMKRPPQSWCYVYGGAE